MTEEKETFFENAQQNGSRDENILTSSEKVFLSTPVTLINYASLLIFIYLPICFYIILYLRNTQAQKV